MKKFKCYSEKKEDWPGFEIEANFPDKVMVCLPLEDLLKDKDRQIFLLIPQKGE